MKVSPHTHCESNLTGSTISNMVARAVAHGRTHFAYTDHGHISSALKAYSLAKKANLKFIPGIEIYFKDPTCPIISGSPANRCKYFAATIYCEDQEAYQELCQIVSRTDMPTLEIYEEKQQLWGWTELETISKFNVNIALGGVHCMVGKPMLAGHADLGEKVLDKLQGLFADKIYLFLLCEPWTKKWNSIVEIRYVTGESDTCLASDYVTTDRARRMKALDLIERGGHSTMKSIHSNNTFKEVNLTIDSVKLHKGFLPLPGGDASLKVNRFMKALGNKKSIPVLASDYAYYANKEDKIVQTMRLEGNNKLQPNLHMKTQVEIEEYLTNVLGLGTLEANTIFANNEKWAARFNNLVLKYDWRLADSGGEPIKQAMEIIKRNGRMKWDNPIWVARLKEELEVIAKNPKKDLTGYFLPIRDVLDHYTKNGRLTGPGRGSAGGSLFCYLLGITQVNPFKYDLPFSRFFSTERIMMGKLPDIDVDLEGRELLVGEDGKSGYMYGRWGNMAAQISTRTTIRLKSAIKDTNRYFKGKVEDDIEVLTKGLPAPPQGVSDRDFVFGFENEEEEHIPGLIEQSDDLRKYSETRPEEWKIVGKAMGLTRAFSRHASAFVLSNVPIKDVVPTKDGNITQYEAKECEASGLIKYDFLVIHQLRDIRVCMDLIKKKAGRTDLPVTHFPHEGKDLFVWDLPEVPEVFKSIWGGNTETLFQINTRSMMPAVMEILPTNIMQIANILALIRPGPVDCIDPKTGRNMVEEYYLRRKGMVEPDIKELADILPETYGIMIFQEQLGKISRELAGFSGEEAEKLRENMAKKKKVELMKMKPQFIEGASKKVPLEIAETIWDQMETFGRYGFSIIHAVEYALVTYSCMFLKNYYPLEWWAAVLTNATEQEISGKLWPYVKSMVASPDINLSTDEMVVDYANGKIRAKLGVIRGMGEITTDPLVMNRPYGDITDFVNKEVAGPSLSQKLILVGVLDSLFPPKSTQQEKLQMYHNAVEVKNFASKSQNASLTGKKLRATRPKEGKIPGEYLDMHPLREAALKKSILPSMPINLYDLGRQYSKVLAKFEVVPSVIGPNGHPTMLIDGEKLKRLDDLPGDCVQKDIYIAATCYVIKTEEFPYAKDTKRALKLTLDADGHVFSEKVLWPDYNSGKLVYPAELKKGSIATVFFRKKVGKKDMSIQGICVEA